MEDTVSTTANSQATPGSGKLMDVGMLLGQGWDRFKRRWKILLSLEVIGWAPFVAAIGIGLFIFLPAFREAPLNPNLDLSTGLPRDGQFVFFRSIAHVISVLLSALSQPARGAVIAIVVLFGIGRLLGLVVRVGQLYTAAQENAAGFGQALRWGIGRFLIVLWYGVVFSLFTGAAFLIIPLTSFAGGAFPGLLPAPVVIVLALAFLLVGLPAIVYLATRFVFVLPLVALREGSWQESWRLTSGRFWGILGRLLLFAVLSGVISAAATFLLLPAQALLPLLFSGSGSMGIALIFFTAVVAIARIFIQIALSLFFLSYFVSLLRDAQTTAQKFSVGSIPLIIVAVGAVLGVIMTGLTWYSAGTLFGNLVTKSQGQQLVDQDVLTQQLPSPSPTPLLGERITDTQGIFSLEPPYSWVAAEDPQTALTLIPALPGFTVETVPRVDVFIADSTFSLANYIPRLIDSYQERFTPTFKIIDNAPVTTMAGQPAHIIGYVRESNATAFRYKELVIVENGKAYVVRAADLAETWESQDMNKLFDAVLTSFEIVQ